MAYTNEIRDKVNELINKNYPLEYISRMFDIPTRTLRNWKNQLEDENYNVINKSYRKEQFIESSWKIIAKSNELIYQRISRAMERDKELDDILDFIKECVDNKEIKDDKVLKEINHKLSKIKIDNISDLTDVINTMYQKQALLQNESTINVGVDKNLENVLSQFVGEDM